VSSVEVDDSDQCCCDRPDQRFHDDVAQHVDQAQDERNVDVGVMAEWQFFEAGIF
jgi:hypothetical protein